MGETENQPFQFAFNSSFKVDVPGARVTSDGGLVLVRELDERLGFGELIARHLADSRGRNTQLPLTALLRQSVYSRLAGYGDIHDAVRRPGGLAHHHHAAEQLRPLVRGLQAQQLIGRQVQLTRPRHGSSFNS